MGKDAAYYRARYARRTAGREPVARTHAPRDYIARPEKRTPFVAIDGEAFDTGEYFLLAASTGDTLTDTSGISTAAAFEFLLDLKRDNPKSVFVGFGFNYDVNMILRDVHRNKLLSLWESGTCEWLSPLGLYYRLEWIPSKRFGVRTGSNGGASYRGVTINDVFGFFQMSFVSALGDWKIPDEDGALERIVAGKAERGAFREADLDDVTRYCLAECRMLVALMDRLRDVFYSAGIRPSSWNGAGSAAGAVLRKHGVRTYHRPDEDLPRPLHKAVMSAYYGGRSEVFQQGLIGDCGGYDINSAYPAVAAELPTLIGEWKYVRDYDPHAAYAVWRVEWDCDDWAPVQPFPYRHRRSISYPVRGRGWYWADETRAAIRLHNDAIRVTGGWRFYPDDSGKPFAFVYEYFRLKAEAKAADRAEQKAYKLALNSLYGKLAQGVGYRGKVPWQRSYVWAGMITSGTRARLLEMATAAPDAVVFMATDGIVFSAPGVPSFPESDALGGLEYNDYPGLFVAQSGIYCTDDDTFKCRGLFKQEVDFDRLQNGWRERGPHYTDATRSHRFVGLGTALMRTDPPRWEVWRTWGDDARRIQLYPGTKYVDHRIIEDLEVGDIPVPPSVRWVAPDVPSSAFSEPYSPKTGGLQTAEDPDYVQASEQPDVDDSL